MKKLFCVLSVCCLFTSISFADVTRGQCVADAAKAKRDAISAARDAFEISRISCQGPCHEACVNTFSTCVGPFKVAAEECENAASEAFASAREACRVSTNCGDLNACYSNVDFQTCLVEPRVAKRVSLKACHATKRASIKSAGCEAALKTCRKSCREADQSSNEKGKEKDNY